MAVSWAAGMVERMAARLGIEKARTKVGQLADPLGCSTVDEMVDTMGDRTVAPWATSTAVTWALPKVVVMVGW